MSYFQHTTWLHRNSSVLLYRYNVTEKMGLQVTL